MAADIEIATLDIRYERYRLKDRAQERRLLASIGDCGIEEPLEGVDLGDARILLNGFKRYRCAQKLRLGLVPYASLGTDEAMGIVALLRISNTKSLCILEQAGFIDELHAMHKMSVAQIAEQLSRSKAWVSMRLGLIGEMTEKIRAKVFEGSFPVYPYMYTLRQFMRMNSIGKEDVEDFVVAVSGKGLSVRDIEQLAHGYFRGPESLREQIRSGNIALSLAQMNDVKPDPEGCNEFERILIKDLEITQKYMQRIMGKGHDSRLRTRTFYAQANLLTAGILSRTRAFTQSMRELHDRSGQAQGDCPTP